jgi:hypothetical protein
MDRKRISVAVRPRFKSRPIERTGSGAHPQRPLPGPEQALLGQVDPIDLVGVRP